MNKIRVIFLLSFLSITTVFSQNRTVQKRVSHPTYGSAVEESIFDKDSTLIVRKIFTLNKEFTKEKYEIGIVNYYYLNRNIKAKGSYYKLDEADIFGQRTEYKQGKWTVYDEGGNISATTFFKKNKKHGDYIEYYPDGKISGSGTFKLDKLNGVSKRFFVNGQLHREVIYTEGKLMNVKSFYTLKGEKIDFGSLKDGNGTFKSYDLKTGKIETVHTVTNGIIKNTLEEKVKTKEGAIDVYTYKNNKGGIKKVERFLNGVLEGTQETYTYNGKLKESITYSKGIKNGIHKRFFNNGTLFYEYTYVNGKKVGPFKEVPEGYAPKFYALDEGSFNSKEQLTGRFKRYLQDKNEVVNAGKMNSNRSVVIFGTYENNRKVGVWKTFDEHGNLIENTKFSDKKNNVYSSEEYFENTKKIKFSVKYDNKQAKGVKKEYYLSGNLKSEKNYKNEILDGEIKEYYENGQLKIIGQRKKGDKSGRWKHYDREGLILKDYVYTNHCCFATTSTDYNYYNNGKLSSIIFQDDHKQNPSNKNEYYFGTTIIKDYYKNGQLSELKSKKKFKYGLYGVKHGLYQFFDKTGTLKTQGHYEKDKEEGIWEYYNHDGKLSSKITYVSGERLGAFEEYEYNKENKKKKAVTGTIYKDRKEQKTTYYYENGEVKETGDYIRFYEDFKLTGRTCIWNEYYKSGKIKSSGRYEKSLKVGEWKFYHENGEIAKKGSFLDDKKDYIKLKKSLKEKAKIGKWEFFNADGQLEKTMISTLSKDNKHLIKVIKEYYKNKQIKSTKILNKGLLHGEHKEFYSDGQLKWKGKFYEGIESGIHEEFFESGRLKFEITYNNEGYRSNVKQYYDTDDRLKIEMQFDDDGYILNILQYFDIKGNKLEVGTLKNGTGTLKYYDRDNKVIKIENFIDGDIDE